MFDFGKVKFIKSIKNVSIELKVFKFFILFYIYYCIS